MIELKTCFTYAYSAGTFADYAETVTVAAVSTNSINLDAANLRIAGANPPWLIVRTVAAFGTIVSLGIKLITDSVEPVLDAATADDVMIWRFALAVLLENVLLINAPLPHFKYKKWITLEWEPYTNATPGSIVAYLAPGPESAITAPAQTVEAGTG